MEDFELYLARRRRTGRIMLVVTAVLLLASVLVPYLLMKRGIIHHDVFQIFVAANILLAAGAGRAAVMRLRDKGQWPR